ncbi:uncharacterized protein LOC116431974 [Nomia melanderi]|uniref:uncharacterized protein LOC116431974 n=1 Tax=Nomia melanderi TaxID=2448451 RepID=UPI0013045356|nr:uncharacterized protein LOC116431974 [Nomia melanderi]
MIENLDSKQIKSKRKPSCNSSSESHIENKNAGREIAEKKAAKTASQRKKEKEIENVQKMFVSNLDPFEKILHWWETEYVKYAINYPPVKSALQEIMDSYIVRLTDRKYMQLLTSNTIKYHGKQQKMRIDERKLKPPSIISRLMETSYKALTETMRQKNCNKLKFYL